MEWRGWSLEVLRIVAWPMVVAGGLLVLGSVMRQWLQLRATLEKGKQPEVMNPPAGAKLAGGAAPDDVQRAWDFYKHADDLQHRRHQLFLTVEGVLIAGFIASQQGAVKKLSWVLSFAGVVLAILWVVLAWTVQRGMEYLNSILAEKGIYREYLTRVRPKWRELPAFAKEVLTGHTALSGKKILNVYLPITVILVWLLLFLRVRSS